MLIGHVRFLLKIRAPYKEIEISGWSARERRKVHQGAKGRAQEEGFEDDDVGKEGPRKQTGERERERGFGFQSPPPLPRERRSFARARGRTSPRARKHARTSDPFVRSPRVRTEACHSRVFRKRESARHRVFRRIGHQQQAWTPRESRGGSGAPTALAATSSRGPPSRA